MENYLLFILTAMLIIMMHGPGFALVTKILSRMVKWWDKDCFRNDIWNDDSYNNGYVRTLCYPNEICYVIYMYKICWGCLFNLFSCKVN